MSPQKSYENGGSHVRYRSFSHRGRVLWAMAVVFFGFGDVVTTVAGLQHSGIVEFNPVLVRFSSPTIYGVMVGLKYATFGICYLLWRATAQPHNVGVPFGLAFLGIAVTGWNLAVIVTVLV